MTSPRSTATLTLALTVIGQATAQTCANLRSVPTPVTPAEFTDARFHGIAARSATDAWAVGRITVKQKPPLTRWDDLSYVARFDGERWRQQAVPSPPVGGTRSCHLNAVAALGPNDVWAAGAFRFKVPTNQFVGFHMFLLHWDGRSWTHLPPTLPIFGSTYQGASGDEIYCIEALASNDIWFFGYWPGDNRTARGAMALHYDGKRFAFHPTPWGSNGRVTLRACDAVNAKDIWAVGEGSLWSQSRQQTYVLRWNGSRWNRVLLPTTTGRQYALRTVLARSATDVWIAGVERQPNQYLTDKPYVVHFDGRKWTRIASTAFFRSVLDLNGQVWAIGHAGAYRWNGRTFALESKLDGRRSPFVSTAAAVGACDAWIVGTDRRATSTRLVPMLARLEPLSRGTATTRLGCGNNTMHESLLAATLPRVGRNLVVGLDDLRNQSGLSGRVDAFWMLSARGFSTPCGVPIPGLGVGGGVGDFFVDPGAGALLGPVARSGSGSPAMFRVAIPGAASLVGLRVHTQGLLKAANGRGVLTSGLELVVGR